MPSVFQKKTNMSSGCTHLVSRLGLRGKLDLARRALGQSEGSVLRTVGDGAVEMREVDRCRGIDTELLSDKLNHAREQTKPHMEIPNHVPS